MSLATKNATLPLYTLLIQGFFKEGVWQNLQITLLVALHPLQSLHLLRHLHVPIKLKCT